jgi:hypothetical protein
MRAHPAWLFAITDDSVRLVGDGDAADVRSVAEAACPQTYDTHA